MVAQDFPQNPAKSWTTYHRLGGGPILNPNRGRVCRIPGTISAHPPAALNLPAIYESPPPRLAYRKGAIMETYGAPVILSKILGFRGHPIALCSAHHFKP